MSGSSTIGSRIRSGRVNARLTQTALAKALGVSPQAVSQWERDQNLPGIERLSEIADRIRVSVDWLTKGVVGSPVAGNVVLEVQGRGRRVMIVDIETLGAPVVPTDYITTQFPAGERALAVTVADSSMQPEFRPGDVVVIDPDLEPLPGDFICAIPKSTTKPLFRRYRLVRNTAPDTGTMVELAPLNPDWPIERYNSFDDLKIIGVMTEHTRRGRAPRS